MAPTIFEYSDYRKFLREAYDQLKETNDNVSYRWFAKKAGFSSSGFLYLVIDGDRNLTKDYVTKFSKVLGLNKKEQQYFDAMVSFNQSKTPETKRYYLELLHSLKKTKAGATLNSDQYEYLSRWYYPVIRELVTLSDFLEDSNWIHQRLNKRVTQRQIAEAIETLLRLKLIKRNADGRLVQSESHAITDDEVRHAAAYSFHRQMISLASEMLAETPPEKREFNGVTMAVSKKQFLEIKEKIKDFTQSIGQYLVNNPDVPDDVYQLHMNFFPITNNKNGK